MRGLLVSWFSKDRTLRINITSAFYAVHHGVDKPLSYCQSVNRKVEKCVICDATENCTFALNGTTITPNPHVPEVKVVWASSHNKTSVPATFGHVALTHPAATYGHYHEHHVLWDDEASFDALALQELKRTIGSLHSIILHMVSEAEKHKLDNTHVPTNPTIYPPHDFYRPMLKHWNFCSKVGRGALCARALIYTYGNVPGYPVWPNSVETEELALFTYGLCIDSPILRKIIDLMLESDRMPVSGWIETSSYDNNARVRRYRIPLKCPSY
jgi:hypothetical protein